MSHQGFYFEGINVARDRIIILTWASGHGPTHVHTYICRHGIRRQFVLIVGARRAWHLSYIFKKTTAMLN
jgi:hypothetical protein